MNSVLESIIQYDECTDLKYIEGDTYLETIDKLKDLSREEFQLVAQLLANSTIVSTYFDISQSITPFASAVCRMKYLAENRDTKKDPLLLKFEVSEQIETGNTLRIDPSIYFSDYIDFKNGGYSDFKFIWEIKSIYDIWKNNMYIEFIEDIDKYLNLIIKLKEVYEIE